MCIEFLTAFSPSPSNYLLYIFSLPVFLHVFSQRILHMSGSYNFQHTCWCLQLWGTRVIYKTLLNDSMPSPEITYFEKQKAVSYLFCSYKQLLVPLLVIRGKKKKRKCRTLLNSHCMFELDIQNSSQSQTAYKKG